MRIQQLLGAAAGVIGTVAAGMFIAGTFSDAGPDDLGGESSVSVSDAGPDDPEGQSSASVEIGPGGLAEGVSVTFLHPAGECEVVLLQGPGGAGGERGSSPPGSPNPPEPTRGRLSGARPLAMEDYSEAPAVPYRIRVDGLPAESAEGLELHVWVGRPFAVDDPVRSKIEPVPVGVATALDGDSWLFEGVLRIGYPIEETYTSLHGLAWIAFPDTSLSVGEAMFTTVPADHLEGIDPCDPEGEVDFTILEQRYAIWVKAEVGGTIDEQRIDLVSYDADPTLQSTITFDEGSPEPISPLGFEGYSAGVVGFGQEPFEATASAGAANAYAATEIRYGVSDHGYRVTIGGDFRQELEGTAAGGGDAWSLAVASSGVLFTLDRPMAVEIEWDCEVEVGLMVIENRERAEVLVDNNAETCEGRYTGRLESGVVYQLLASIGLFDDLYASEEGLWNSATKISETTSYDRELYGSFGVTLAPAG